GLVLMHTVRRLPALLAALLAVGLIAACGSDPEPAETDAQATPERVVSLSPSATETLWAIGAGSQVIAVDGQSNYPADVPTQQDLSGFTPNVEAIIAYQPDLVIIDDAPDDLAAGLQAAGIPLLSQPAPTTLDDAYAQIEQ